MAHSLDGRMTATVHKMAGKEDQIFLTIDGKDELLLDLNHFDLDAARSNHPRKSPLPGYHDPYGFDPEIRAQMGAVYDLAFSPSGAVVYFLTNAWGTGSGIFAIDRGGGKPWYVRASNALYVIETCSDSALVGKLMAVPTHQFYHDMDLLQTTVLIDDQGNTLGVVGNEAGFIYRRCGVGSADPSTDERAPEPFQKPRFRCGDTTVRHYALERLDGTIEDIFRLGDNRWTSSLADLLEITNGCPKKTY